MSALRLGRPGVAVIVAPHPDDETIGAYGLIRLLVRRGWRVWVVVVSDGAASHPSSARWPVRRLVAERRRETRAAMRRAGVPAGAIRFLGLPDGGLSETPACAATVRRVLRRVAGVTLMVGPEAADDHPDHRAVARAMARASVGRARRLAYHVWGDGSGRGRDQMLPLPGVAMKRSAIRAYRSQCGAIADDPAGFSFSSRELARFSHPIERYRAVSR